MKLAFFTTLSVLVMTSTSSAFFSESVTCESFDHRTQINVIRNHRPDIEIVAGFDSENISESNDGIESFVTVGGHLVTGRVEVLSVAGGTTTDVTEITDEDILTGEPVSPSRLCKFGRKTVGLQMQARLTVAGRATVERLICSSTISIPHGSVDCVDVAPDQPSAP